MTTKITNWHIDPTLPRRYMSTPLPYTMVKDILLRDDEFKLHHTSAAWGYVTRQKCKADNGIESGYCYVELYNGRFGNGWKIHHPSSTSTGTHWVSYWVLKRKEEAYHAE